MTRCRKADIIQRKTNTGCTFTFSPSTRKIHVLFLSVGSPNPSRYHMWSVLNRDTCGNSGGSLQMDGLTDLWEEARMDARTGLNDGWMHGQRDGRRHGRDNGWWRDGRMDVDGGIDTWTDPCMHGRIGGGRGGGRMHGWVYGRMDCRMDGWND